MFTKITWTFDTKNLLSIYTQQVYKCGIFNVLTWNNCELSSLGHISLSPQNGLTVIVFSSILGRLSLNPPSIYLTPWNFGGISPEKNGMKADARSAWSRSSLLSKCETMTFWPSCTLVRETCSLPLTFRWASFGRI